MKKREDFNIIMKGGDIMTAHEKLKILDLNSYIISSTIFYRNENTCTFPRLVLMYSGNIELANIDLSCEKDDGIQNLAHWYLF